MNKVFAFLQGRHTGFAIFFAIVGVILQWFHHLDSTFVAYMTSLMGMVLGHSIQENHFAKTPADQAGSETQSSDQK